MPSTSTITATATPSVIASWAVALVALTNLGTVPAYVGDSLEVSPENGTVIPVGETVEYRPNYGSVHLVAAEPTPVSVTRFSDAHDIAAYQLAKVSEATGVPAELIAGKTPSEMEASAARINAWKVAP